MNQESKIMKSLIKFAIPLILFGVGTLASAQTNSCPSIAPYKCNNGSCTNDPALCDQSWGGGLSNQSNTDTSGATPAGQTLAPATPSSQQCTGNLRYDRAATERCARLAESEGRARGYNITCNVEERESVKAVNAAPVGSETMYFSTCTINGQTGFSPETLVGYKGSGSGIQVHDNFFGTTTVYGSGFNINSMWYSVPCALVDGIEGKSGTLVGSHTCTAGATQYFGSGSASSWTPNNATKNRNQTTTGGQTGGTNPGKTITSFQPAGGSTSNTGNNTLLAQIRSMTSLLNRMIEQARQAYGAHILNTSQEPLSQIPNQISTPIATPPNYLFELSADKTSYCVGETPKYTITGSPSNIGSKILWSSWLDNASTNEFDIDYGHKLASQNGQAFWSDYGSTWNSTHIGQWVKQANVNGLLKNVRFEVKNCSDKTISNAGPTPTTKPLTCSPKTQIVGKYSVAYVTVADSSNPDFDWSAIYTWSAPSSTKDSGVGWNFGTSYTTAGTYNISVTNSGQTDTCSVTVY